MKIKIYGKNIEVTEGIRTAVEDKLAKLDRYLATDARVDVTLRVVGIEHKIEVTIPMKGGHIVRAEESSTDMYATMDLIEETIEQQLIRHKKKIISKKKVSRDDFKNEFFEDIDDYDDEEAIDIVRTKRFGIKPMDAEEACIEMDLLGHNFFVFLNSETDEVNVVYKRKDGRYGLIEPAFD